MVTHSIFISYARDDGSDFANHIKKYFEQKGHKIFLDIKSIDPGENWEDKIRNAISECDIFLIIVTPIALERREIEKEYQ